jgi:hypothetical protein
MTNIQFTTENNYDHPIDSTRATGIFIIAHVDWKYEFYHVHNFNFKQIDRINPDVNQAYDDAEKLILKMQNANLNLDHFKNSEYWTLVQN